MTTPWQGADRTLPTEPAAGARWNAAVAPKVSLVEKVIGPSQSTASYTLITTVTPAAGDVAIVCVSEPSGIRAVSSVSGLGSTWARLVGPVSSSQRQEYWLATGITSAGAVTVTLSSAGIVQAEAYVVRGLTSPATFVQQASSVAGTAEIGGTINASAGQFVLENTCGTTGTAITNGVTVAPATGWVQNTPPAAGYGSAYRIPTESSPTPHQYTSLTTAPSSRTETMITFGVGVAPQAVTVGRATAVASARTVTVAATTLAQSIPVGRATSSSSAPSVGPVAGPVAVLVGRATSASEAHPAGAAQPAAATTHSIYGAATPAGAYSVFTDGTPSIVLGETFYRYGGDGGDWTCSGGRVWTPVGAPATITIRLYADAASTGGVTRYLHNLDSAPIREVTVATNPGGWTEGTWAPWPLAPDGQRWMIGYTFPTAPADYIAATDAYPDNNPVYAADGFHIVKSESTDLSAAYGPVDRGYFVIGGGTPAGATAATGYGIDTLVVTAVAASPQTVPVGRASGSNTAQPVAVTASAGPQTVNVGRATTSSSARPIGSAIAVPVGRAASSDTARTVTSGGVRAIAVGRATTTSAARSAAPAPGGRSLAVGRASSASTGRPVAVTVPALAPTYRAGTSYDGGAATTHPVVIPATTQVGDLLVLVASSSYYLVTPVGWTRLLRARWDDPHTGYIFVRTALAGDAGSTLTLGFSDTNSYDLSAAILTYANATAPASVMVTQDSNTQISFPDATGAVNQLYLAVATHSATGAADIAYTGTPALNVRTPSSFTDHAVGVADRVVTAAGSVGSAYHATSANTGPWAAVSMLLTYKAPTGVSIAVGRATEADSARAVTSNQLQVPVGRATETDAAGAATAVSGSGTPQVVAVGRAMELDIAQAFIGRLGTDTSNRVGGRNRQAIGTATWEPPVATPPPGLAVGVMYDTANTYTTPTYPNAESQPVFDVITTQKLRHVDRIVVGGKDITYWRGAVTPIPSYQLIEPMLYGPGALALPQVSAVFEQLGVGALKFLRKGAEVLVQRVRADGVVVTDYRGFIASYRVSGADLICELGGELSGRAGMTNQQVPIWKYRRDVGVMAYTAVRDLGLRLEPKFGPVTGIKVERFGGTSTADYINQLCSMSVKRDGTMYTLMPTRKGVYHFKPKDTTTVDATVYFDDERMKPDLTRDMAEEPNRIFATGITPEGKRVKFGVYPGLRQGKPAPYPFDNLGHTFGQGTTDADTNSGDGITVMIWKLIVQGYLELRDQPGAYDDDVTKAIKDLQEDAGLPQTGDVNYKTWRALYDLAATGYSLRWSKIVPAAERDNVRYWNRTASGSVMGRNPTYNPTKMKVDRNIDVGTGFNRSQIRDFAKGKLQPEDNWVGTLSTGNSFIHGTHVPGTPITPDDLMAPRALKPGMNLWAPLFDGGTLFHVSGVTVSEDGTKISAMLDTQFRDAIEVWQIIERNRESRKHPARAWIREHRSSTMNHDSLTTWDEIGGVLDDSIALKAGWNVFPVLAGQEGTISRLRLQTTPAAEYVTAVFGREIRAERLAHTIGDPLTKDGSRRWTNEAVRNRLDKDRILLYVAGDYQQPCGYFPKQKAQPGTPAGDVGYSSTPNGRWEDDAGIAYRTFKFPVVYVAVYVDRDCKIPPGRIMWNQLESSV